MTRRGFTLIELILAMSMVAMLMLALYSGMSTAFNARKSLQSQTEAMRQAKIALDLIEQDLRSMLPPTGTFAGPFLGTPAGTGSASIDCYSLGADYATLDQPASDGMRHVILSTQPGTDGLNIVRDITRDILNGTSNGTPDEDILAHGVSSFTVQYYDGSSWTDTWDSTQQSNALPLAIEVTIGVKKPQNGDANHVYLMARTIMLSCGLTPDQATAVDPANTDATSGTTGSGTSATGTGSTGGTQ